MLVPYLVLIFFLHLVLTGVCQITVNMVVNAPKPGMASSVHVMELDTVVPLVIIVSDTVNCFPGII